MKPVISVVILAASTAACMPMQPAPPPYQPVPAYQPQQMQVVSAAEAPPPPAGKGWHCFDVATRTTYEGSMHDTMVVATSSRCERTASECERIANGYRSRGDQDVGFCKPARTAACTATWTNAADARYMCAKDMQHCGPVGGFAPLPDQKQSECTQVL